MQAHHVRYPDDWFKTTIEDLITLCRGCHRIEHGLGKIKKPKKQSKPPKKGRRKVVIVDAKTLGQARARRQISRDEFKALREQFGRTKHLLKPIRQWQETTNFDRTSDGRLIYRL